MTVGLEEPVGPAPSSSTAVAPSFPFRANGPRRGCGWRRSLVLVPVVVPLGLPVWRVASASGSAWDVLFSTRTGALVIRSAGFTAAVTASAAVIGVAAAWITERYDLRGRRTWTVLVALPLVIPSYVIALTLISFFGARGLFADMTGQGLPALSAFRGLDCTDAVDLPVRLSRSLAPRCGGSTRPTKKRRGASALESGGRSAPSCFPNCGRRLPPGPSSLPSTPCPTSAPSR